MAKSPTTKPASVHDAAVDALMALLAERPWGEVSLADVAQRAGVSLADLRGAYPSTGAILGGFVRRIDLQVLKEGTADLEEGVRERLFDLVMRRLDAMAAHKAAIRNIRDGLMRDPLGATAFNSLAVTSQQWTLAAAGVNETGAAGAARAQVLSLAFARIVNVWLDDDEPGQARTLRALDEELGRLERLAGAADRLKQMAAPLGRIFDRMKERRARHEEPPVEAV